MKLRVLVSFTAIAVIVLISCSTANAQIVEKVKEAADKTREVTIDTTEKTVELTKDAADKSKSRTAEVVKKNNSGVKRFGSYSVELVDKVQGKTTESGRWLTVTTWDGAKWVSKRIWSPTKKAADKTTNALNGSKNKQP